MKKIFILFLLGATVLSIAACGKAAKPQPYPDSGYPHSYPYNQ